MCWTLSDENNKTSRCLLLLSFSVSFHHRHNRLDPSVASRTAFIVTFQHRIYSFFTQTCFPPLSPDGESLCGSFLSLSLSLSLCSLEGGLGEFFPNTLMFT